MPTLGQLAPVRGLTLSRRNALSVARPCDQPEWHIARSRTCPTIGRDQPIPGADVRMWGRGLLVVRMACVALVAAALAGCGDHKMYQLVIDNTGPVDVVVVATGLAQDRAADELINGPAFVVDASSRAITPTIAADIGPDGRWEMAVVVLSTGCEEIGSLVLDGGPSLIQIDAAGSIASESVRGSDADLDHPTVTPIRSPCR